MADYELLLNKSDKILQRARALKSIRGVSIITPMTVRVSQLFDGTVQLVYDLNGGFVAAGKHNSQDRIKLVVDSRKRLKDVNNVVALKKMFS